MRALVDQTVLREAAERRDVPPSFLTAVLLLERSIDAKRDRMGRIREALDEAASEPAKAVEGAPVEETEIAPLRPGPPTPPGGGPI